MHIWGQCTAKLRYEVLHFPRCIDFFDRSALSITAFFMLKLVFLRMKSPISEPWMCSSPLTRSPFDSELRHRDNSYSRAAFALPGTHTTTVQCEVFLLLDFVQIIVHKVQGGACYFARFKIRIKSEWNEISKFCLWRKFPLTKMFSCGKFQIVTPFFSGFDLRGLAARKKGITRLILH